MIFKVIHLASIRDTLLYKQYKSFWHNIYRKVYENYKDVNNFKDFRLQNLQISVMFQRGCTRF